MEKGSQKKRKGGAEKERDRKRRRLEESASKCRNLLDIFKSTNVVSVGINEDDNDTDLESGPSGVNVVTMNSFTAESADDHVSEKASEVVQNVNQEKVSSAVKDGPSEITDEISVDYFKKPCTSEENVLFWNYHPNQKTNNQVVKRSFFRKDGTNRWWLSYNKENHSLHCSVCIAFLSTSENSAFIKGLTDWRHVHTRVEEHERSSCHLKCSTAYLVEQKKSSVSHLLARNHHDEIGKRRQVMERVVDVVKLIGKRGLSYRGSKEEAAYTLDNDEIDHGTFLEVMKLLGKYDSCTADHLSQINKKSKKLHEKAKGSRGRGALITLLSKSTVNSVITVIRDKIRQCISEEITDMFSVEIDTTQDISTQDQCSVIVRYVDNSGDIQERLVSVVKCDESSGEAFVQLVSEVMSTLKLDLRNCVGNSTDGAANMQGRYKGFSTLLSKETSNHLHVWCHAHVLNLVVTEATSVVVTSSSLFSLLNDIGVFFRESHQRMNLWMQHSSTVKRIGMIGDTRWWSKDAALKKVFGSFNNPTGALFKEIIITLNAIKNKDEIRATIKAKAHGYIESLLKFETVLTAEVYLRIFSCTTPLSKYLQTVQLDLLTVHNMVDHLLGNMQKMREDFQVCHNAAEKFAQWANDQLNETDADLVMEETLPLRRQRRRKCMAAELSVDEATSASTPLDKYRIEVYNRIVDTIVSSIEQRFDRSSNSSLYADLSLLHPRNFGEVPPASSMEELHKHLLRFNDDATAEELRTEFQNFVELWPTLKQSVVDVYPAENPDENHDDNDLRSDMPSTCDSCKACPLCCYKVLLKLNIFSDAYRSIGLAYKFLLTLPVSQVACERSFSALKRIKSRLRSTMTQEHLEAFMLMSVERKILSKVDNKDVIDGVVASSEQRRNLLS